MPKNGRAFRGRLIFVGNAADPDGSDQYGGGKAFFFGDEIQTVIHAVNQINIRKPGPAVHDGGAFCFPARGMAGGIVFPDIGFRFGNDGFLAFEKISLPSSSCATVIVGRLKKERGKRRIAFQSESS